MTNETRDAIGEGGRGLSLSLVVDDKDASEKLKIDSDSLPPKSDSQSDSNDNSTNTAPLIPTKNNWDEIHDMLNETPPAYTYHGGRIQLLSGEELESVPVHFTVEDGRLPDCNINDNGTADYE